MKTLIERMRESNAHFGSCPAKHCDGPCCCERIATQIEQLRVSLTTEWNQYRDSQLTEREELAVTPVRQLAFEAWVIVQLAEWMGNR